MPTDSGQPAVLLVSRNLPPLLGGMERLVLNMARGIDSYAELTVIGPKGCRAYLPASVKVYETPTGLVAFLICSTLLVIRTCVGRRFDLVVGGSGLTAPALRIAALLRRSTSVIYLHGLDLVVDSGVYRSLFLPCIRSVDRVITNSRNTRQLAEERGVKPDRISVINPGTDLPAIPKTADVASFLRQKNICFERPILFVGRMTQRKGLSSFINHSLPEIIAVDPGAGLVVVGDDPKDSLNNLGERDAVLRAVAGSSVKDRILFLGHLSDEDLLNSYGMAQVQILPLVDVAGDVEGFGMVAVEAAACGTPTVAFELGGVADAIGDHGGVLVTPGDYSAFTAAVLKMLQADGKDAVACRSHAEQFSWKIFNTRIQNRLLEN